MAGQLSRMEVDFRSVKATSESLEYEKAVQDRRFEQLQSERDALKSENEQIIRERNQLHETHQKDSMAHAASLDSLRQLWSGKLEDLKLSHANAIQLLSQDLLQAKVEELEQQQAQHQKSLRQLQLEYEQAILALKQQHNATVDEQIHENSLQLEALTQNHLMELDAQTKAHDLTETTLRSHLDTLIARKISLQESPSTATSMLQHTQEHTPDTSMPPVTHPPISTDASGSLVQDVHQFPTAASSNQNQQLPHFLSDLLNVPGDTRAADRKAFLATTIPSSLHRSLCDLLSSVRTSASPTSTLIAMKNVVGAVKSISNSLDQFLLSESSNFSNSAKNISSNLSSASVKLMEFSKRHATGAAVVSIDEFDGEAEGLVVAALSAFDLLGVQSSGGEGQKVFQNSSTSVTNLTPPALPSISRGNSVAKELGRQLSSTLDPPPPSTQPLPPISVAANVQPSDSLPQQLATTPREESYLDELRVGDVCGLTFRLSWSNRRT